MDISRLVIEVDSSGFLKAQGNAKVFETLLNKIQGTATKTERSVKGLESNLVAFQLVVGRLPGPLKDIAGGLLGMVSPATAAAGAIIELTGATINFARESLQAFSEYEMIKTNLELVMGSAEKAGETFEELRDLAAKTPFSLPGVAQAASMLRQADVAAGDLVSTIEMLGNVSGGSMERFNRIAYNYTQVLQKGVLDTRDQREFANSLVPINKMLQQLGVTGTATADDMQAAFRLMTQEGGMFFNAINRQGETMTGKTEQLKEAWQEFQATWAETSGLGELWKNIIDNITEAIRKNTEELQRNADARKALGILKETPFDSGANVTVYDDQIRQQQELLDNYLLGIGYNEEKLLLLIKQTKELKRQLEIRDGIAAGSVYDEMLAEYQVQQNVIKAYKDQIDALEKMRKPHKDVLEQEEARTIELEKQRKLVEDLQKEYKNAQSFIDTIYAETPEGKLQELINKRNEAAKEFQKLLQGDTKIISGYTIPYSGELIPDRIGNIPIDLQKIEEAKISIAYLQKQIDDMKTSMNRAETPEWIKILQDNTGFTVDQMEKMWAGVSSGKSLPVIEQFEQVMDKRGQVFLSLFGDNPENQLQTAQNTVDAYRKLYEDMFTVTLDKDGNIITVWTESEEAARKAKSMYEGAVGELNNLKLDQYIQELNQELTYLQMSNKERERAVFINERLKEGFSPKDAEDAWKIQQAINEQAQNNNFDEYIQGLNRELEYLKLSNEERERAIFLDELLAEGYTPEQAREALRIQEEINNRKQDALDLENFEKYLAELDKANKILSESANEQVWANAEARLKEQGVANPMINQVQEVIDKQGEGYLAGIAEEYRLILMDTEEAAVHRLAIEQSISEEVAKQAREGQRRNNAVSFEKELQTELDLILMNAHDEAVARLAIERNINKVDAERLLKAKESLDYIKNGANYLAELDTQLQNALESIRAGNGGYGEYAGALAGKTGLQIFQGSDAGNFLEGFQTGGIWGAIINTLINAIVKVIGTVEGVDRALSPITEILMGLQGALSSIVSFSNNLTSNIVSALAPLFELINQIVTFLMPIIESLIAPIVNLLRDLLVALKPLFSFISQILSAISPLTNIILQLMNTLKPLLLVIELIGYLLEKSELLFTILSIVLQVLVRVIVVSIKILSFGLLDLGSSMTTLTDITNETTEAKEDELELLRKLNEQYAKLRESIREQEEYYLQKRRKLNADWAIETLTSVNDMILTPQGTFSTNPSDYIIATKHPEALMGKSSPSVYVQIINNTTSSVTERDQTDPDGSRRIVIMVDQIVQNGIATGKYDGAFTAKQARDSGRRVTG